MPDNPPSSFIAEGRSGPLTSAVLWFSTLASTITVFALGWFLISNLRWFQANAFPDETKLSPEYYIHIHHLFLATLKRSVALFTGFSLTLLGLGVAFYTVKEKSKLSGEAGGASFVLASSSPGIIAMTLGVIMILHTTQNKDTFGPYDTADEQTNKEIYIPKIP